jgi:hypothetical protein
MLAQLVIKLKWVESSRAKLTTSRASSRATSILSSPNSATGIKEPGNQGVVWFTNYNVNGNDLHLSTDDNGLHSSIAVLFEKITSYHLFCYNLFK